jgi:hypothetical protein
MALLTRATLEALRTEAPEQARAFLIDLVLHGRMTPDEAETDAARLGLPRLANAPHPSEFDPMEEARWSLFMTLAWAVWRTPEAVCNQWDEYRTECEEWIIPEGAEHNELWRRRPASWESILAETCCVGDRVMDLAVAKDALWRALTERKLYAIANSISSATRRRILAHHWVEPGIRIKWVEGAWRDVVVTNTKAQRTHEYLDLDFDRTAVMSIWPPRHDSASAVPKGIRNGDRGPLSWMYLVIAEYRARVKRGEDASIPQEAERLSDWLHDKYPTLRRLSGKRIRNELYRLRRDPKS